ncbi:hypothetical protein [Bacillus sp. J14TS2]|nr:hypothetical protein [Bacillus sp. J14TS2]
MENIHYLKQVTSPKKLDPKTSLLTGLSDSLADWMDQYIQLAVLRHSF